AAANPASSTSLPPEKAAQAPEFGRMVNDAQLAQSATHSEMRIAMQTDRLGTVELRARVTGDEVGAAIAVEKRDAHAALAAELPALQQALSERHLRVEHLSLLQGGLHSSPGDSGAQQQQQPERPRMAQPAAFVAAEQPAAAPTSGTDTNLYF